MVKWHLRTQDDITIESTFNLTILLHGNLAAELSFGVRTGRTWTDGTDGTDGTDVDRRDGRGRTGRTWTDETDGAGGRLSVIPKTKYMTLGPKFFCCSKMAVTRRRSKLR